MVEDRVTDGRRLAQLLASELTGLSTGPLAAVAVVDADPDATPDPDPDPGTGTGTGGTLAYRVTYEDERVGRAVLYPERVALLFEFDVAPSRLPEAAVETDGGVRIRVESGAAVKRAVDAVRELLRAAAAG